MLWRRDKITLPESNGAVTQFLRNDDLTYEHPDEEHWNVGEAASAGAIKLFFMNRGIFIDILILDFIHNPIYISKKEDHFYQDKFTIQSLFDLKSTSSFVKQP